MDLDQKVKDTRGLSNSLGGLRVVATGEAETSCVGAEDLHQKGGGQQRTEQSTGGLRHNFGEHLHVVATGEAETSCVGAKNLDQKVEDNRGLIGHLGQVHVFPGYLYTVIHCVLL